jgi:integrase
MTGLPPGITRDRRGFRAYVRVRGVLRPKRFPADTPIETMQIWQLQQRMAPAELVETGPPPGTLAADVSTYLELKRSLPTYQTRQSMMALWVAALGGSRTRASVTSLEVAQALSRWETERKYSGSTLNHFRSALSDFYARMDPGEKNPVAAVPKYREPAPAPRGLPYRVIRAIMAQMPRWKLGKDGRRIAPSKTRAVFAVMAYTGMPPAVIRQLRPEHVLWKARAVVMPARKKGAGTVAQRRALTRQGLAALKRFAAADAWGGVKSSTMTLVWHRAVDRARERDPKLPIPADVRAYDLRHSYGEAVYRTTSSIAVTAGLLGHLDERTTRRYITGAIDDVEQAAVDVVSRRLR